MAKKKFRQVKRVKDGVILTATPETDSRPSEFVEVTRAEAKKAVKEFTKGKHAANLELAAQGADPPSEESDRLKEEHIQDTVNAPNVQTVIDIAITNNIENLDKRNNLEDLKEEAIALLEEIPSQLFS